MIFYLGTHKVNWLKIINNIPLFLSFNVLKTYKKLPYCNYKYAIDSGAFTELNSNGKFITSVRDYAINIKNIIDSVGHHDFVAIQDWMCEPFVLKRTGLSVKAHIRNTVINYLSLININPSINWLPTLQGYSPDEYYYCLEYYSRYIDISKHSFGIGSICRRSTIKDVVVMIENISKLVNGLHCFGVKVKGLPLLKNHITSSDSMAWSFNARKNKPLDKCSHKNCANCIYWAINYYKKVMSILSK